MEIQIKVASAPKEKTGTVIVAAFEDALSPSAEALDNVCQGQISKIIKLRDFKAKLGQTLLLPSLGEMAAEQILIIGAGKRSEQNTRTLQKLAQAAIKALNTGPKKATSFLAEILSEEQFENGISDITRASLEGHYVFDDYKSKVKAPKGLTELTLALGTKQLLEQAKASFSWGKTMAKGINYARHLGNIPANICHPSFMADAASHLAKEHKSLKLTILGEAEMKKLGMGAFLAVSQGSEQEGKLIVLEYKGGKKSEAPVAIVGKGITFDTGGISIKPAAGMEEMKYDMCGAASVMGVMQALAESELPINVVGVMACAENMPSGRATRPGDIVTTMSGQTVEIVNTDAEGRLVLCDALTYVGKYKPAVVIDLATLTGACVVALGKVVSGLFSPSDSLAADLVRAGEESGDRTWRMPVWSDYQELLDCPHADMSNVGGPSGGAITAACFLARFTEEYTWAHLDIAGVAWLSGPQKSSTGRPVPLLLQYLKNRIAQA